MLLTKATGGASKAGNKGKARGKKGGLRGGKGSAIEAPSRPDTGRYPHVTMDSSSRLLLEDQRPDVADFAALVVVPRINEAGARSSGGGAAEGKGDSSGSDVPLVKVHLRRKLQLTCDVCLEMTSVGEEAATRETRSWSPAEEDASMSVTPGALRAGLVAV